MLTKCLTLFLVFFKLGMFSIGGGYVILPLIYEQIAVFNIMTAQEFSNLVGISQMTPGPIAVNAATYVGYSYASFAGAAVATIGVILPSFFYMTLIFIFLDKFKKNRGINSFLVGIRPATVGLITSAVLTFARNSIFREALSLDFFTHPLDFISVPALCISIFAGFALKGIKGIKLSPLVICMIGGVAGALFL